ncbi:MAG: hypothetical protein M1536_00500 [Firmicutes bacterium]|nr:hypothetical protein [Bacillota bacterium]
MMYNTIFLGLLVILFFLLAVFSAYSGIKMIRKALAESDGDIMGTGIGRVSLGVIFLILIAFIIKFTGLWELIKFIKFHR